jgi:two-component system cell cycle sensor histidine kinase/response regulator CckA
MTDSKDPRLAAALTELAQLKRWFDVQDAQLQVLDRERQKFAAVVSQSDTPMFAVDGERVIQWTNAALRAELERSGSSRQVVGLAVDELWKLLGVDQAATCVARALGEAAVIHDELRLRRDSSTRALYVTALPIKDKEGRIAEALVMVQDLSDLELLRQSEARYRLLFEQSPDAMVMASLESGTILLANQAARALTGYGAEELEALSLEQLHAAGGWPGAREAYARMADGAVAAEHTELELLTRLGRTVVAKVTASRFNLDDRPVTLLVMQDVTMQRKLEAELRHSQKMEVVGRLAAGVTHEFNNIMTVILAGAEMLKLRAGEDRSLCEIAETTEKAAHRAALLTRKLLGFSRKDRAKEEVLDLNEVVTGIEGLLVILLGERVALHTRIAEAPCLVLGDRQQLEEVVFNLAANARDAMPQGGNLWLEVMRREPREVVLRARDDGMGMDPKTRDRLFEPFFTTKAPHEGTGLGMSTILDIVERHGGAITVESAPGQGATFLVSLPETGPPSRAAAPDTEARGVRGDERILVVDDRGEVRRAAARLLGLDGYTVQVAASAEETMALLEKASFDLLITDVVMPGMGGVELAARVERQFPQMRVLFMSAYADREVAGAARLDFIQKPFSRGTLSRKVRDVLDRPKARRSASGGPSSAGLL